MKLDKRVLYWGAFLMIGTGLFLKEPSYAGSGLVLMWLGLSVK